MFPLRDDRPTYSAPVVTTLLIVACALVFFFELSLDEYSRDYFINQYGLVPSHMRPVTLISSMFLHGGWMHIIGNMLFLWAFGKSLEDAMGHTGKFLIFYVICGVAAGITHVFFSIPASRFRPSGPAARSRGVMGAYLVTFPRAKIHTLVFLFFFVTMADIPAAFILVYWFLTQLLSGYGSIAHTHVTEGGVAWFAHVGGFITRDDPRPLHGRPHPLLPRHATSTGYPVPPAIWSPVPLFTRWRNMLDLLAIAAHPDDVEQTCGGTMLRMAEAGYRTGIIDLTAGDTGSSGLARHPGIGIF